MWYNGSTKASQALDEGSIPFARTKNSIGQSADLIFAYGVEENPAKRVRKQVDFASKTQRNRYGLRAGIYAERLYG